jgi:hypothetical protein
MNTAAKKCTFDRWNLTSQPSTRRLFREEYLLAKDQSFHVGPCFTHGATRLGELIENVARYLRLTFKRLQTDVTCNNGQIERYAIRRQR